MRGKVRHCTGSGDPKLSILIHSPLNCFGKLAARNGCVYKLTGFVSNTLCNCKFLGICALCNIENYLFGVSKCVSINIVYTLRNVEIGQSEAIAKRVCADVRNCIRKSNLGYAGNVKEAKHTYALQLATFLKYHLGNLLSIAERIITNGCYILTYDYLLDKVIGSIPGLIFVRGKVRHCTGSGDAESSVGVKSPVNVSIECTGLYNNGFTLAKLVLHVLASSIRITYGILCNLKDKILICRCKCIYCNRGNRFGNVAGLKPNTLLECARANGLKLAVFLKIKICHCSTIVECIIR